MAYDPKLDLEEFENSLTSSGRITNELAEFNRQDINHPIPTKEDVNLGQIYKGAKKTTILAKPLSFMATPVLEAARAPFKYIAENVGDNTSQTPPIDTAAEYKSIYPSGRATTTNLLTDFANSMGIYSQPLAAITSKDYPKAAAFAESMTNPYSIAGIAADTALASNIPQIETPQLSKFEMAKNYLAAKAKDKQLLQTMSESGKINDVAAYMADNDKQYIRPFSASKTLDYIEGPLTTEKGIDGGSNTSRDISKGKLGQLLEDQNQAIENIPGNAYEVPKHELAIAAKAELYNKNLLPTQQSAAEKMIDDIINVTHPNSDKIKLIRDVENAGNESTNIAKQIADESIKQVMGLSEQKASIASSIKDIPETIANPEYAPGVRGSQPAFIDNPDYAKINQDINSKLDAIDSKIQDIQNGKVPAGKNFNLLSQLKKQKASLEKFYNENIDNSALDVNQYMDFIDKQNLKPIGYASDIRRQGNKLMSAIGNETPQEMGSAHAAGSALESAGRNAQDQAMAMSNQNDIDLYNLRNKEISNNIAIRDLMNNQRTSPQNKLSVPVGEPVRGVTRELMNLYPEYVAPYTKRAQQFMLNKGVGYVNGVSKPLSVQLASFAIPRSSNEILNNKDAVLAKVAQEVKTPEGQMQFEMLKDALDNHPEKLKDALPGVVMAFPQIFAQDKYNRVDGRIFDPMLLQKAQNDLKLDKSIPASDKAIKMEELINKKELHDN